MSYHRTPRQLGAIESSPFIGPALLSGIMLVIALAVVMPLKPPPRKKATS